jgi:glycerol-3-phosphate dehydrogenase
LAAFLPDQRIQFVIPHAHGTLCGTTEVEDELLGDERGPPAADVDYLLQALAFLLEPAPQRDDVRFGYCGWRSLPRARGPAGALNREAFVVGEKVACGTLHTIVGGKLTTHRSLAERVVRGIFAFRTPSPTRRESLPGGEGPREVTDPLWWRHGSRVGLVRELIRAEPAWGVPLCPHRPFLAAELVMALRHDGASTFADAMVRRLVHEMGPCRDRACLRAAHALFLRERRIAVDDDVEIATASLCSETGEWSAASASHATDPLGR